MSNKKETKGRIFKDETNSRAVHILSMEGDIDDILSQVRTGMGKKRSILRRTIELLIGLSLKGYEGKPVGAIFLVGDIENLRRYTSQMIINPFKGWKDINILDEKQQLTFESFSQLDGAFILDNRGFAHYAGRMIHVKVDQECIPDRPGDRKGTGTRWRAAKHITENTKTVAVSLSHSGEITVFERGKEIGRIVRRVMNVDPEKLKFLIMKGNDNTENGRIQ